MARQQHQQADGRSGRHRLDDLLLYDSQAVGMTPVERHRVAQADRVESAELCC